MVTATHPAPQRGPTPRLAMVVTPIATAPGVYRCTSSTHEGVTYTVDAVERRCDCQAGRHGRPCRHVAEVHRQNAEAAIAEQRRRAVDADYARCGIGICACGRGRALFRVVPDEPAVCVPCAMERLRAGCPELQTQPTPVAVVLPGWCRIAGCPNAALSGYAECSAHIFGEA